MKTDIPGHPGFSCDTDGVIYGKRGKPLAGYIDRCGYHEVLLSENGKTKNYLAHRLVLASFKPCENMDELQTNHKNGNKLDNRLDNLEWCSRSENIRHSYSNGLQKVITNPHGTFRVLAPDDLATIRDMHAQGFTDKAIAERIGCSREIVSRKIRGMKLR